METPSSLRRATRSQASIKTQKAKKETLSSRSALADITNDSPITGVAMEKISTKTPNRAQACKNTPRSGESLLRGQVKNFLQKVEEEAEFVNKIALEDRPPFRVLLDLPAPSPVQMIAPTPANTPQVIQILEPVMPEETLNVQEEESIINRTLLFDSPNSENTDNTSSISSSLSYQGSVIRSCVKKAVDDDSSSAWSLQVNVSLEDEDEEETITDFDDEEEGGDEEYYEVICDGMAKITVHEEKVELNGFEGKHTRFVYDSDDEEIKGEELVVCDKVVSPSAVVLKGLPVPEGKHLRFYEEEEEEEN